MEAKKKKKIVAIVCAIILVIAIAIVGIIFSVRKNNGNKSSQNVSNVNTENSTTITNTYNEAIAKEQIPANYSGRYKYSHVASIDFHFDDYPVEEANYYIQKICENKGVRDVNGLINLLNKEQLEKTNNGTDVLVFQDGIYTKNVVGKDSYGNEKYFPTENGTYVGDDNLAVVRVDGKNKFFMSLNYKISSDAITAVVDVSENNGTKLYVYETIVSSNDPTLELFTVTYVYDMFIPDYSIPDENLDF